MPSLFQDWDIWRHLTCLGFLGLLGLYKLAMNASVLDPASNFIVLVRNSL